MFGLTKIFTKNATEHGYQVIALEKSESTGAIKAFKCKRSDGKETIFTAQRFAELRDNGSIVNIDDTKGTFTLKVSADFKPEAKWQPVDLG